MTTRTNRDNAYWLARLKKDGHDNLLQMIKAGDITVYRATVAAGLRKTRSATSRADQISYHYSRATLTEKRRFIIENWSSVARIVGQVAKELRAREQSQKPDE
jgi:hypothetical protein